MNFRERPIIITDVETTGLNPRTHEIVDIGAVKVDHSLNLIHTFWMRVQPRHLATAEPKALEINGYNAADWRLASLPREAAMEFGKFSADGVLAAWNITFEHGFLQALDRNTGVNIVEGMDYHRIDIPSIAWALLPGLPKLSLDKVGEYFGMPAEEKPHTGLRGAEYEWRVLRHLRGLIR